MLGKQRSGRQAGAGSARREEGISSTVATPLPSHRHALDFLSSSYHSRMTFDTLTIPWLNKNITTTTTITKPQTKDALHSNNAHMSDPMSGVDLKSLVPQPKQYKKGPFTVEASGYEKKDGETIPRRHPLAKDKLIERPEEDIKTVYDVLRRSSEKYGNAKALGHRKLIKEHHEVKQIKKTVDGKETTQDKTWTYYELSEYNYMSFVEYEKLCHKVGAGFRKLGMEKGDRVHIFAATR